LDRNTYSIFPPIKIITKKMKFFFVIFFILIFLSHQQRSPFCILKVSDKEIIDLNNATFTEDFYLMGTAIYDFYINICQNVNKECEDKKTPNLIVNFNDPTMCYSLGKIETQDDVKLELIGLILFKKR
jgi:hypothetical protein